MRDGGFAFRVLSPLTPQEAWRRVVDVKLHGRYVPFTNGRGPSPSQLRVGDVLVARTAWGPLGFDDVMEVVAAQPGRFVRLVKRGRIIGGSIEVTLQPLSSTDEGSSGTAVAWRQELAVPWLPQRLSDVTARVVAPLVGRGYRVLVSRLLEASAGRGARN